MNEGVERSRPRAVALRSDEVLPGISKPRAFFLLAAGISFLRSISLYFTGSREQGIFVGIWVPSILSAGTLLLGGRNHE